MNLVTSFVVLVQELGIVMTVPSFHNFLLILGGWVFARRRTITGTIVAGGLAGRRHHAAFHRLFAEAAWSLPRSGPGSQGISMPSTCVVGLQWGDEANLAALGSPTAPP